MNENSLVTLFLEKAAEAGATTATVNSAQELQRIFSEVLLEHGSVYCPGMTDKEKAVPIPADRRQPAYESASITIEESFSGVAETGTVICSSASGKFLQASLLPEHHVAIVPREKIFPTFSEFFASLAEMPTNITLITGPSRTADIEKTLIIGMHGPKKVTVIVW